MAHEAEENTHVVKFVNGYLFHSVFVSSCVWMY